jgi:transposase-like protein
VTRSNPPTNIHPPCPECGMGMLLVNGFELERERQTFECLRCGHVDEPVGKILRVAA